MASSGNGGTGDSLFKGAKFWLSQTVPQRLRFKEMIAKHGGTVVLMEKDADVKLVDHAKKGIPPDTYSYRYVERSILNGRLEDLEAHRAGTSRPRPTGATHIATKGTRQPFTLKDDQILFDWIAHIEKKEPGAPLSGNKVYIELEQLCPRHSWQSWRTRYVRQLRGKPRPGGGVPQSHPEFMQAAPSSSKRKRDSGPKPVDKAQAADSSSKRRAVDTASSFAQPRPRVPSPGGSTPSNMAAKSAAGPQSRDAVSPSPTARAHGIRGDPTPFQVPSPFANTRRGNLAFPPPPFNTTQQPIPVSRPRGDNAFAQSGRFKKQPNKDRPQVDDPFKDPVDAVFLELPFFPSSPTPDVMDDDTSDGPDVDTWIDERLSWGIDENHVFDALRCTSMVPDMADKVLKHLAAGNGIPEGIPGVWTADDDRCLQAEERANVERALTKHGAEFVKERWEYYRMAREAGLI
ncbi:Rap1 - C-terminal [Penicillium canescens]|uniref:DNA-binding protein RAP1 n=1 Tax=Penicillium canescens TaxID=5083 RepID=A0AAD6IKU3_PENCN|nr:Rap1 - C-terminal [Penicillium canescens]KAJ6052405.1 Rap1 - C-terminal [Penicillium canescens]KAJ6062928.1 Rap1 - C-terminal [Penicillium canescens]